MWKIAWLNFTLSKLNNTAPIVYEIPPANNHHKPSELKLLYKGLMAKTMIQPISTYIIVDRVWYLPVKKSLRIIPVSAIPQTTPKIVQPTQPSNVTSAKGV